LKSASAAARRAGARPAPPERSRSWRRGATLALALAALTVAAFWQVTRCGFVNFDDDRYVTENAHVRAGLALDGVRWAWTTFDNANWHPLTWMSHMLDVSLFGLDAGAHHGVSLLLHALASLLLFGALARMTRAPGRSAVVAGLFAVHPLHVESVAWISERKDVLSGLFAMLTLWAYAGWARRRTPWRYALVLACFALGLAAKSMLVTLPFVLLLLDCWPLRRMAGVPAAGLAPEGAGRAIAPAPAMSFVALLLEKAPLLALSAFVSVVTLVAQRSGGAAPTVAMLGVGSRVGNALLSAVAYLGKTFWPARLCFFYPYRDTLPVALCVAAAALLLLVTALAAWQWRARPWLGVGWLWFAGMLVPVIGLVQVGEQAMADRYMYLPSVGLFILLVWGGAELARRLRLRESATAAIAAAVLVALALTTRTQVRTWTDSTSLFEHALAVTRRNATAEMNYGVTLLRLGRLPEARRQLDAAVADAPRWGEAIGNRGVAKEAAGQTASAIADYQAAVRLEAGYAPAHRRLAEALFRAGRYDEALAEFDAGVSCDPSDADLREGRGATLATLKRYPEAEAELRRALELRPGFELAGQNLERLQAIQRGGPAR
jgi:protein O-mannosyl-transferase